MEYEVLGPISTPNAQIYATYVRATGTGMATNDAGTSARVARIVQDVTQVALPGFDVTIDLREVVALGDEGWEALMGIAAALKLSTGNPRILLLARLSSTVHDELISRDWRDPRYKLEVVEISP